MTYIQKTLLLLVLAPISAFAEPVTIRGGDHENFTRLVFSISSDQEWDLFRNSSGYTMSLADGEFDFEEAAVFSRLNRNRIDFLEVEQGELQIGLSCNCFASSFVWREDRLVVDIIEGDAPETAQHEGFRGAELTTLPEVAPVIVADSPSASTPLRLPIVVGSERSTLEERLPRQEMIPNRGEENSELVNEVQQAVLQSLTRAAAQGLVFSDDIASILSEPSTPAETQLQREAPQSLLPDVAGLPGVFAHTSIERDIGDPNSTPNIGLDGAQCPDVTDFQIADWSSTDDYFDAKSDVVDKLTSQTGALDTQAVLDLARIQVHFGFGDEAIQTIDLLSSSSTEIETLRAIAAIVDGRVPGNVHWQSNIDCPDEVSLWAILSLPELPPSTIINEATILQSTRTLPVHIRTKVGPQLVSKLLNSGFSNLAESIADILGPDLVSTSNSFREINVDLKLERGEIFAARIDLEDSAESNPRLTPQGLIRLIDLSLEMSGEVDVGILRLAEVMRFENAGSQASEDLLVREVTAYSKMNDFSKAFALLSEAEEALPANSHETLRSDVVANFANFSTDVAFLQAAFDTEFTDINRNSVLLIAERLVDLGFVDHASQLMQSYSSEGNELMARYIHAEISASNGLVETTATILEGIETPRANLIRIQSSLVGGDYEGAIGEGDYAPDTSEFESLAWRSGNLHLLSQAGSQILNDVAELEADESSLVEINSGLNRHREFLNESADSRTLISELFETFPRP